MRCLISLASLALVVQTALADDAAPAQVPEQPVPVAEPAPTEPVRAPNGLSVIDRAAIPESCASHLRFTGAFVRGIAIDSRLRLARCAIDPSLAKVDALLDSQESMIRLETAVAPSLAIYAEAMQLGSPAQQSAAATAKAKLYGMLLAKMSNIVPAPTTNDESALALFQTRQQLLETLLLPWREAARETAAAAASR